MLIRPRFSLCPKIVSIPPLYSREHPRSRSSWVPLMSIVPLEDQICLL